MRMQLEARHPTEDESSSAVQELRIAFDAANRTSPSIIDAFVLDIIQRLAGQTVSESEIDTAVRMAMRYGYLMCSRLFQRFVFCDSCNRI
jgi:hypothetical protein